jgi:hypothetical protein
MADSDGIDVGVFLCRVSQCFGCPANRMTIGTMDSIESLLGLACDFFARPPVTVS